MSPAPIKPAGSRLHRGEEKMNKTELIAAIADATELPKTKAGEALDATLKAITDALVSGDTVSLVGFGTFDVRHRAARVGRNPRTGEKLDIKASKSPGFKPGKALKESVNN